MEENRKNGIWTLTVGEETIKIENKLSIAKLYINDKLQDVYPNMFGAPHLTGKLKSGKEVKAVIGGDFKMHCYVFVDNECLLED